MQAVGVSITKAHDAGSSEESYHVELPSSTTFDAKVNKGYLHGKCSVSFADGACAEVFCIKSTICGPGVISYHDARYYGELRDGKHHGKGTLEINGGDLKYEGKLLENAERHASALGNVCAKPSWVYWMY
jgi:hypothetical protein